MPSSSDTPDFAACPGEVESQSLSASTLQSSSGISLNVSPVAAKKWIEERQMTPLRHTIGKPSQEGAYRRGSASVDIGLSRKKVLGSLSPSGGKRSQN